MIDDIVDDDSTVSSLALAVAIVKVGHVIEALDICPTQH
jgi:hypothetical protein